MRLDLRLQQDKQHGLPQCMPSLTKARVYKMTKSHPLHDTEKGAGTTYEADFKSATRPATRVQIL